MFVCFYLSLSFLRLQSYVMMTFKFYTGFPVYCVRIEPHLNFHCHGSGKPVMEMFVRLKIVDT